MENWKVGWSIIQFIVEENVDLLGPSELKSKSK